MATHSSTFSWKIPWTEEPGRLQSMGSLEPDMTERLHFHFSLSCIGEGNGNPLQCCCLENPRDGGACWAAVYGVAQSRTWLKQLSSSRQCGRSVLDPWVGKIPWRRKWQPTPVLFPGKSHGWRSLVGYSPWRAQRVRLHLPSFNTEDRIECLLYLSNSVKAVCRLNKNERI